MKKEQRPGAAGSEASDCFGYRYGFLGHNNFSDNPSTPQDSEATAGRQIWWSLSRLDQLIAAQEGVILLDGGKA